MMPQWPFVCSGNLARLDMTESRTTEAASIFKAQFSMQGMSYELQERCSFQQTKDQKDVMLKAQKSTDRVPNGTNPCIRFVSQCIMTHEQQPHKSIARTEPNIATRVGYREIDFEVWKKYRNEK